MKTLKSKIEKSRTKNRSFFAALNVVNGKRVYTNYITGSGKWTHFSACNPEKYLNEWGIDFQTGNDAPRGGKMGDFIELSTKGNRQTKEYRNELEFAAHQRELDLQELMARNELERELELKKIEENILLNAVFLKQSKIELNELKNQNNKKDWHILANKMVQIVSGNNFSLLKWSEIFNLIKKS